MSSQVKKTSFLVIPFSNSLTKCNFQLTQQYNTWLVFKYNSPRQKSSVKIQLPDIEREGGVYIIPCQECLQAYIRETKKIFKTRISQHIYDIPVRKTSNAKNKYMFHKNHPIDFMNSKFIFNGKNKNHLQLIDFGFISKLPNYTVSMHEGGTNTAVLDNKCRL